MWSIHEKKTRYVKKSRAAVPLKSLFMHHLILALYVSSYIHPQCFNFNSHIMYHLILALHVSLASQVGEEDVELVVGHEAAGQRLCRGPEPVKELLIFNKYCESEPIYSGSLSDFLNRVWIRIWNLRACNDSDA
jgi:hypothetical protein